jgi:DNA helicase HerA-like ATPase
LESPGVRLRVKQTDPEKLNSAAPKWLMPLRLTVAEVAALGCLPIGVPLSHPVDLPCLAATSGRRLGVGSDGARKVVIGQPVRDALSHTHIMAPTGAGKSWLLVNMALDDIEAGRSLVFIDPKSDAIADLLARIPEQRRDEVVVLDPTDATPVGLNPLTGDANLAADAVVAVFASLFAASWGPRTADIAHASLLAAAHTGLSLVQIPHLLSDAIFRLTITTPLIAKDPIGMGSFWGWYENISEAERGTATAPLLNKLRQFLLRPGVRAMLGQAEPRFDLADVFTHRRIVLVDLAKGKVGPEAAHLLGSLIVSQLWSKALARVSVDPARRHPVMLFVDEVQDYLRLPTDLGDILAQARGLGLGMTLAHQHLGQLPSATRAAVLANTRSKVFFRLASDDAPAMAKGHPELSADDLVALPPYRAYASLPVTDQRFVSISTTPLPEPTSDASDIRSLSRERYGRPIAEVEAAWITPTPEPVSQRRRARRQP